MAKDQICAMIYKSAQHVENPGPQGMTMLHLDSNQIQIKQSSGFLTTRAGCCFMADAESLHECGRWEVKSIRGGGKQEGCRFQWGQLEGKFASRGRCSGKPP